MCICSVIPCLTIWGQCGTAALLTTADRGVCSVQSGLLECDSSKSAVLTSLTFCASLSPRQTKSRQCHGKVYLKFPLLQQQQDEGIENCCLAESSRCQCAEMNSSDTSFHTFFGSIQERCDKWNEVLLVWDLARFCSFPVAAFLID